MSGVPEELEVTGLTADSRAVVPGDLFAALPGQRADGRRFIDEAVARGAAAVLAPQGTELKTYERPVALVTAGNPRRALAAMAARFYPGQPKVIAAVTGTNGKTSVASFTRRFWQLDGRKAVSLGTLGLVPSVMTPPAQLTTPDPVGLHQTLQALAENGVDHLAIEASSHGLDQYRLDGLRLSAAAFTNLSHDHLDYHGTLEAYLAAKLRLFTDLLCAGAGEHAWGRIAVVNADSRHGRQVAEAARQAGATVWTYGRAGKELRLIERASTAAGQRVVIEAFGERREARLPLVGDFQAGNVLAALGLAVAGGLPLERGLDSLESLDGVPGRMERVAETAKGAGVVVDYAHTPDALETALKALRDHAKGRLVLIFGCGGDRDRKKRPVMGEIAARLADRAIVTDDNPRSENPAAIRQEILAACPGGAEIGDRRRAIETAVAGLEAGDLLLIAGKGHETGQTVGDQVQPFDDRTVAREAVRLADEGGRA